MSKYRTLSAAESRALLAARGQVHSGPHRMTGRVLHWAFCVSCRTLDLNNDATRRHLRAPCRWEE